MLPVWALLQPRDYINSLQLITALGLVVVGLITAGLIGGAPLASGGERIPLEISAPMIRANPEGAPAVIPFLFITIACGACSGFHCLVSSGTSSKQIKCETDAQFVGYGSMLTEGFLATLVILACVAGSWSRLGRSCDRRNRDRRGRLHGSLRDVGFGRRSGGESGSVRRWLGQLSASDVDSIVDRNRHDGRSGGVVCRHDARYRLPTAALRHSRAGRHVCRPERHGIAVVHVHVQPCRLAHQQTWCNDLCRGLGVHHRRLAGRERCR